MKEKDKISVNCSSSYHGISLRYLLEFLQLCRISQISKLTTNDIVETIIIPNTKSLECSYIELLLHGSDETNQQFISNATVYISYSWKYNFYELIKSIEAWWISNGSQDDIFLWIDIFCINYHCIDLNKYSIIEKSIKEINNCIILVINWLNDAYLNELWRICELYLIHSLNIKHEIFFPDSQRLELQNEISSGNYLKSIIGINLKIDSQNVGYVSSRQHDEGIGNIINTVGYDTLNDISLSFLREIIFINCKCIINQVKIQGNTAFSSSNLMNTSHLVLSLNDKSESILEILKEVILINTTIGNSNSLEDSIFKINCLLYMSLVLNKKIDIMNHSFVITAKQSRDFQIQSLYDTLHSYQLFLNGQHVSSYKILYNRTRLVYSTENKGKLSDFNMTFIGIIFLQFTIYRNVISETMFSFISNIYQYIKDLYDESNPLAIRASLYYQCARLSTVNVDIDINNDEFLSYTKQISIRIGYTSSLYLEAKLNEIKFHVLQNNYQSVTAIFKAFNFESSFYRNALHAIYMLFSKATIFSKLQKFKEAYTLYKLGFQFIKHSNISFANELDIDTCYEEWYQWYIFTLKQINRHLEAYISRIFIAYMKFPWGMKSTASQRLGCIHHASKVLPDTETKQIEN